MTLLVTGYRFKKDLKNAIGQRLKYRETSFHGNEYRSDGKFVVVRRPHLMGGGTEWFASIEMERDRIVSVK
mgnify:CR=1 FL=1